MREAVGKFEFNGDIFLIGFGAEEGEDFGDDLGEVELGAVEGGVAEEGAEAFDDLGGIANRRGRCGRRRRGHR